MAGTASKPHLRTLAVVFLLTLALWSDLYGWFSAYAAVAGTDPRPVLTGGGWACGAAVASFLAATALYRSLLVRIFAVVGVASVLPALAEILRRLNY